MNNYSHYKKYEKMVSSAAWKVCRRYNHRIDFDDLMSQGGLIYTEALSRFDETKGVAFGTFLTWRLRTLWDYAETYNKPTCNIEKFENNIYDCGFEAYEERLNVAQAFLKLSIDGQYLVNLLLAGTFSKIDSTKKPSKTEVVEFMKKQGWKNERAVASWDEVAVWWKVAA